MSQSSNNLFLNIFNWVCKQKWCPCHFVSYQDRNNYKCNEIDDLINSLPEGKNDIVAAINCLTEQEMDYIMHSYWPGCTLSHDTTTANVFLRFLKTDDFFGLKLDGGAQRLFDYWETTIYKQRYQEFELQKEKVRQERQAEQDAVHDAARKRNIDKQNARLEWQAVEMEKRNIALTSFNLLDNEGKVLAIARDKEHMPEYYPFDFSSLSDCEIAEFTSSTLDEAIKRFENLTLPRYKRILHRLKNALTIQKK